MDTALAAPGDAASQVGAGGPAPEPSAPEGDLLSPELVARLAHLSLLARRMPEARRRGQRRTRRHGGGTDLVDTRPYAPGDDPRRIAWAAYARHERLVIRLVADEAPVRLALVVDTSASMGFGVGLTKLRQAARIAAGLAAVALSGEDRVAAVATSAIAGSVTPIAGGRAGLARVVRFLSALEARGGTDLARAALLATGAVGGRALCVLLGDFFDPAGALAGARAARERGHEVALVEVLDATEVDPPDFDDVDLEDGETGELVTLPARGAREAYLAALADHRRAVDEGAAALGAVVVRATTANPFENIVLGGLQAGLLRSGGAR